MSNVSSPKPWTELLLGGWLLVASAIAVSGAISVERPWLVPVMLVGTAIGLVAAYRTSASFRARVDGIPTSMLTALHVVHTPIGAGFLVLSAQGQLDPEFAGLAGVGDVVAGILAFGAIASSDLSSPSRRRTVLAAHALGLLDILAVVVTAQRILLFSGHPETLSTMPALPWALLPTFVVPLVITTHFAVLVRALRAHRRAEVAVASSA